MTSPQDDPKPAAEMAKVVAKLDDIAQAVAPINPQQELKRRIVAIAKRNMLTYYNRWPERMLDERGRDTQELHLRCVEDILDVVDDYLIDRKR